MCDKVVNLGKSLAGKSGIRIRLPWCNNDDWPWLIQSVYESYRVVQRFAWNLESCEHSVTRSKLLSMSVEVTNVQAYLHLVRPIDRDAIAEFEFYYTRKWGVRILDEL